ncbi:hypothetical protein [Acuticoccus sp.]|uniref:hypothetical protein n=1 Tax=Acuticoccus sp. TaxID=1904378 RepID=UPI003B522BF0
MPSSHATAPVSIEAALGALPERVNADARLVQRGRHLSCTVLLRVGDEAARLTIDAGRLERVDRGPFLMPDASLTITAAPDDLARYREVPPPPGFNDVFALMKRRSLSVEGDMRVFMANLLYFKGLLAHLRPEAAA